ncbi:MAG: penicillin-insensitive murein endopeptidase [Firmicutes bacterium]|nr:penicillin-insensitive murein endopeptidase [Bacillota bacterium]
MRYTIYTSVWGALAKIRTFHKLKVGASRKIIVGFLLAIICLSSYNVFQASGKYIQGLPEQSADLSYSMAMPEAVNKINVSLLLQNRESCNPSDLYDKYINHFDRSEFNVVAVYERENSNDEDKLAEEKSVEKKLDEANTDEEPAKQDVPRQEKKVKAAAKSKKVNMLLPQKGAGYEVVCSSWPHHQWGTEETIAYVQKLGEEWAKLGYGIIGITDLSLQNGGEMPNHDSHQNGVDVDLYLINEDKVHISNKNNKQSYSQDKVRELIQTILATGEVEHIFYNDAAMIKEFVGIVKKWDAHDGHLHIRYKQP